ncbi:MAG: hypothetical protein M3N23_03460 [Pseudomonadota bacterium]|nr:hypothetical protein [Pseudomonadota bacterium]
MTRLEQIVAKQAIGARFVITAPMLGLTAPQFDALAQGWIAHGGSGFAPAAVPHRTCIDGEFYINRVTVVRTGDNADDVAGN